jgi:hypothetical protein
MALVTQTVLDLAREQIKPGCTTQRTWAGATRRSGRATGDEGDAFPVRRVVAGCHRDGDRSRLPEVCGEMRRPYGVDRAAWRTGGGITCNRSPNPLIPASVAS